MQRDGYSRICIPHYLAELLLKEIRGCRVGCEAPRPQGGASRWRREEAERRAVEARKESRDELLQIIDVWTRVNRIEQFFRDPEQRAAGLSDADRLRLLERSKLARKMVGSADALDRFMVWRAPDERYLIPYGLVGCLAGQMTGLPFLLRHGGSDLNIFLDKGIWANLITKAFKGAGTVITDREHYEGFCDLSKRVISIPPYVPDPAFFKPSAGEKSKSTLALIGKANYYWRHKGWHKVIEIMKSLGDRFHYMIVSQGIGLKDFKKFTEDRIGSVIEWREFVDPLEMPRLLQSISSIVVLQNDLPFPVFSNMVMETLYCNVAVITDRSDILQSLKKQDLHIDAESQHVLVVPSDEPGTAAKTIIDYFAWSSLAQVDTSHREADYAAYISQNEEAILSVIEKR